MRSGICQDCCDNADCVDPQICIDGVCVDDTPEICGDSSDCETGQYCCDAKCVDQPTEPDLINECCVNDDCVTDEQICCPEVNGDENIEFKCRTGNCCVDDDCQALYICNNNVCEEPPPSVEQCILNWKSVTDIIDDGDLGIYFAFSRLDLSEFPLGIGFSINTLTLAIDRYCSEIHDNCSNEPGCEACLANRIRNQINRINFCYNSSCYTLDMYYPTFLDTDAGDNVYYSLDLVEYVLQYCDYKDNGNIKDETQLKCPDNTCPVTLSYTTTTCQSQGISNMDLPMFYHVIAGSGSSCPTGCGGNSTNACQT